MWLYNLVTSGKDIVFFVTIVSQWNCAKLTAVTAVAQHSPSNQLLHFGFDSLRGICLFFVFVFYCYYPLALSVWGYTHLLSITRSLGLISLSYRLLQFKFSVSDKLGANIGKARKHRSHCHVHCWRMPYGKQSCQQHSNACDKAATGRKMLTVVSG